MTIGNDTVMMDEVEELRGIMDQDEFIVLSIPDEFSETQLPNSDKPSIYRVLDGPDGEPVFETKVLMSARAYDILIDSKNVSFAPEYAIESVLEDYIQDSFHKRGNCDPSELDDCKQEYLNFETVSCIIGEDENEI